MHRFVTGLLTGILLAGASASQAANLLTNPSFDTNLNGWLGATQSLNSNDAEGNPGSHSIQVSVTSLGAPNTTYCFASSQCVSGITAGTAYHLTGKAFIPAGTYPGGSASLAIGWYQGANCTNQVPNIAPNALASASATQNQWLALDTGVATAPTGAVNAEIFLISCTGGPNGTTLPALFDDLLFDLVPIALIPTLDPLGLVALAALLAAAALYLRRRRAAERRS